MGVVKLSTAGITNYQKYSSMLAGNATFVPSSFDLLATQVLTSNQSSITFSNLGNFSSSYRHLQIRYVARDTLAAAATTMSMRINGATSGYSIHALYGTGSGVASLGVANEAQIRVGQITGANSTANNFASGIIDLLDPYQAKNKVVKILAGATDSNQIGLNSGMLVNTASVTSIILLAQGNFLSGSRFSLYGIKNT